MKKIIATLYFAIVWILFTNNFCVMAEENYVTINGITYKKNDISYEITSIADNIDSIIIPNEINGLPVKWTENINTVPLKGCTHLKEILVASNNNYYKSIDGVLFDNDNTLIAYPSAKNNLNYAIPEGTIEINRNAFYKCNLLENVSIPSTLQSLGEYSFYQCENLKTFFNPVPLTLNYAIYECKNLEKITISGNIYSIIFSNYPNLKEINFTNEAKIQTNITISNCPMLTQINLPRSDKLSSSITISDCDSLNYISLWNSYLYLSDGTQNSKLILIENCPLLREIVIHAQESFSSRRTLTLKKLPLLSSVIYEEEQCGLTSDGFFSPYKILNVTESGNFAVYGQQKNDALISYCSQNSIPFIALESLGGYNNGDINEDGKIDILDVIIINKAILGKEKLTDSQNKVADVNKNDKVDSSDSLMIMKYIVGLINSFDA